MSSLLTEIVLPQRPPHLPCPTTVTDGDRRSLFVALAAVEDPRDPRGRRYPLVAILAAAVCAVIAGACTFAAVTDWARFQDRMVWARLGFDDRVPAATTVWRLLIRIDAEVLSQVLARWLGSRAVPAPDPGHWWRRVIAVDGKVERGARLPDGRQVHLLSAYDTSTGIVLAQVQIATGGVPTRTPRSRSSGTRSAPAQPKTVEGTCSPRSSRRSAGTLSPDSAAPSGAGESTACWT